MKRYRVEVAPKARQQLAKVMDWWVENRPKARDLFLLEFESAAQRLATSPRVGPEYRQGPRSGVRRLLLPGSHYHIYYEIIDAQSLVRIMVVWHTARARGPKL